MSRSQINDVLNYLNLANRKSVTITGQAQRQEQLDFPSVAFREAVVNAFVHRDYLLHSDIKIELFDDRLEIVSPGGIPDGLTLAEIKDGMTAARNPRLIHILNKMKYIENYGTGIRRIISSYENSRLIPDFKVRANSFKVTLFNNNYVQEQVNDIKKINGDLEYTENELKVIKVMQKEKAAMSRSDIEESTSLTRSQVLTVTQSLARRKMILKVGKSINTKYELA